jgi:catechol 2,3-dioxygenase-like lactoylglutathione lyase family enzyme
MMLGRFLELSLLAPDIGAAWQRWQGLGFVAAETGDVWTHPYGVVYCEGLAIGFHAAGDEPLCLTFVRPEVESLAEELSNRLIGMERTQLGEHVFNMVELREPGGALLRIQEARSFSAPDEPPQHTALGRFHHLSLPCADLAEARGFWERLDLELVSRDEPWEGLAVAGLPIACHEQSVLGTPLLVFETAHAVDTAALRDAGLTAARPVAMLGTRRHHVLRDATGLTVLLLDAAG